MQHTAVLAGDVLETHIRGAIKLTAVSVVFPWSTCPMVPMFTWGLLRSNVERPAEAPGNRGSALLRLKDSHFERAPAEETRLAARRSAMVGVGVKRAEAEQLRETENKIVSLVACRRPRVARSTGALLPY